MISFSGAFAGTKTDSNMYMDTLLSMIVPDKARSLGLDLVAVPNFRFKVKSTAVTNKDMKAEFHSGKLLGVVSPGLIRRGDCSAPGWLGSNITIGCYLSLDALHLSYLGSAKGDSLFNTNKSITLDVVPTNANAFIETTSTLGGRPTLRTWRILPINFVIGTSPALSLNSARKKAFNDEVSKNAQTAILNVLLIGYKQALEASVQSTRMPAA